MKVTLLAYTVFERMAAADTTDGVWTDDTANDASALTEFAGRLCYQSWSRPNPLTATNEGYVANLINQGHLSVLEHGSVTVCVQHASRSLTHELIRHRHFSYSQLSQRYVTVGPKCFVMPPLFAGDDISNDILERAWDRAVADYDALYARWLPRLLQAGYGPHKARKKAREAARCVLPNMTPTEIVVTANHRAWREMLVKRGSADADAEIREMAFEVYRIVSRLEPALYQDFEVVTVNGEEVLVHNG